MKFMAMHKHDSHTEAGKLPTPEFMEKMGAYIGGMAQSGRLLDGEGLGATKTRSRVSLKGGRSTVAHGPYTGAGNELPASVAKIAVKSPSDRRRVRRDRHPSFARGSGTMSAPAEESALDWSCQQRPGGPLLGGRRGRSRATGCGG